MLFLFSESHLPKQNGKLKTKLAQLFILRIKQKHKWSAFSTIDAKFFMSAVVQASFFSWKIKVAKGGKTIFDLSQIVKTLKLAFYGLEKKGLKPTHRIEKQPVSCNRFARKWVKCQELQIRRKFIQLDHSVSIWLCILVMNSMVL